MQPVGRHFGAGFENVLAVTVFEVPPGAGAVPSFLT
jgi:hypothetical protein